MGLDFQAGRIGDILTRVGWVNPPGWVILQDCAIWLSLNCTGGFGYLRQWVN